LCASTSQTPPWTIAPFDPEIDRVMAVDRIAANYAIDSIDRLDYITPASTRFKPVVPLNAVRLVYKSNGRVAVEM